jgi:hypothetical protein
VISPSYDFDEFLAAMKGRGYREIIHAAQGECAAAERRSFGRKGAVRAREQGSVAYAAELKAFLFWIQTGARPGGAERFHSYRVVAQDLVRRGILKPEALAPFGSPDVG